ncbi:MAG TPA: endonuclease MutS2, partial [Armatimonadota bacterium]|nr:endonuclease MutS2 [Armatimonadota bacterium]
AETTQAVRLLDGAGVPLGGIHDVRPAVRIAGVGGVLEPAVLLEVADTVGAGRKLRHFLLQRSESVPRLAGFAERVGEFSLIEQAVHEAINDHAEVRDDASPALSRLRKELRTIRSRMLERLNSILRSQAYRDMIQDPVITTRDGRYCIPVKSEYRTAFGGLVHDQSSSGATVFMEPQAVVELGNELRQVELKERQEVERILRELTALIGRHAVDLGYTLEALGELDFIFARGKLSLGMDAAEPVINGEGFIGLRRARHPLLTGPVVPIDVELGRAFRVLVITGPNTGGKTVALKTAGLLCLMAQSGLHVPADSGSTLPVFHGIYADIGDEQSIQQSLSTFSGHITNIAGILEAVEKSGTKSLVLLDEAGAGTDPAEGAALAKAILSHLLERGARTIASTHYGELKEFAYSTPGVENASVEFDVETLRPTYRLLIGIPGASNAFSIAARLGLPEEVVQA